MEVLLGGVDDAYSLKALGGQPERDVTLYQTPEDDALNVVGKVIFAAVAVPCVYIYIHIYIYIYIHIYT